MLAESGIDALSYAALHPNDNARYASTGGAMNPSQPALIRGAIERMGQGATIRIATDNDDGGRILAAQIAAIFMETGRKDLKIVPDPPQGEGADWNDRLRESQPQAPAPGR